MKGLQRIISLCLTLCLLISMVPVEAFAQETEMVSAETAASVLEAPEADGEEAEETAPAEETAAAAEEDAEAPETTAEATAPEETVPENTEAAIAPEETAPEATEEDTSSDSAEESTVPDETEDPVYELGEEQETGETMNEAAATSGTCGENLTWSFADGVLTISGTGQMSDYDSYYSPAPWNAYRDEITTIVIEQGVTSIGEDVFYDSINLTSVTIPDSVTSIGSSAFARCDTLTEITLPDTLTQISSSVFSYCISLEKVNIPEGVTAIDSRAFSNCTSLSEIILPDSVTDIWNNAFHNCTALTSVTIPDSVETLGSLAFMNCGKLESITLSEKLTAIESQVFDRCTALKNIVIPDSVTEIKWYAFRGCSALTNVTLPENLTSVTWGAFSQCTSLEEIHIPDGVSVIEMNAFEGCSALKSVTGMKGLTTIGQEAFYNCKALTEIVIPDHEITIERYAFKNCDGLTRAVLPDGLTVIDWGLFESCDSLKEVVIPSSVKTIDYAAFSYCTALESIEIPDGVTEFGNSVFANCTSLTDITIPDSVTTLLGSAFTGCSALTSIVIPDSVTILGDGIFTHCDALISVSLPKGMTAVPEYLFYSCDALAEITLPDSVTTIGYRAFYDCVSLSKITLPAGVTSIGEEAFCNCDALTEITIPGNVTDIGKKAFYDCDALTSVSMADSMTTLGDSVFSSCDQLESVTLSGKLTAIPVSSFRDCGVLKVLEIPDGVTDIGEYAFSGTAVESIVIPDSVVSIGKGVFQSCAALSDVRFPTAMETIPESMFQDCAALAEIDISDTVTSIGNKAFFGCAALTKVILPDSVTSIGTAVFSSCKALAEVRLPATLNRISNSLFSQCISLTNVEIPASVTTIGNYAFNGCIALEEIDIPDGVTSIGEWAFYCCDSLTSISIPDSVYSVGVTCFTNCDKLSSVRLSNQMKTIPALMFSGCVSLTNVILPDTITSIGGFAFKGCQKLTDFVVPEGVTTIGTSAFENCTGLTSIRIPDSVTSIYNDTFSGCRGLVIYGQSGSYAEQYAAQKNFSFVVVTQADVSVRLTLQDEAGESIFSGYQVQWYGNEELIGTGDTLWIQMQEEVEYAYRVILEDALCTRYRQPEKTVFTMDGESLNLTCTLETIPTLTVTGTVSDGDSGAALSGRFRFTQQFRDAITQDVEFSVAADGTFAAEVSAVVVTAVLQTEGYRDRILSLDLSNRTGAVDLGSLTMTKLPGDKITLELLLREAAAEGDTAVTSVITEFDGLEFTVTNTTQGKEITGFALQYPYLLLEEGQAKGSDTLRIDAVDTKNGRTIKPILITLDAQRNGQGTLQLLSRGRLEISRLNGSGENTIMLFDAQGDLVSADTAASGYRSGELAQGSYQVAVLKKTELLRSVPKLDVLSSYELSAGTDYLLKAVSIEDGVITRLDSLTVPSLDESKLCYTKEGMTGFSAHTYSTFAGKYVQLRAEYEIQDKYTTSGQQVVIQLPEGLSAANGSLTLDGKAVPYTTQDNRITVNVNKSRGVIRFYLFGSNAGTFHIHASLQFSMGGAAVTQPLGSMDLQLHVAQFTLPEKTGKETLTISGTAIPDSTLTVYDGDQVIGTAVSNHGGSWNARVTLDNPSDLCYHEITVSAYNETIGTSLTSDPHALVYQKDYITATRVTMYNTGDNGLNTSVFDFENPGVAPSYRFWPGRYPQFSFVAELSGGDDTMIEKVYVVTVDSTGSRTYVECSYDKTRDAWLGTHRYKTSSEAPVSVEVEIIRKIESIEDDMVLDMDIAEEVTRIYTETLYEFEESRKKREEERLNNLEIPDYSGLTLDEKFKEADKLLTEMDILVSEGNDLINAGLEDAGISVSESNGTHTISMDDGQIQVSIGSAEGLDRETLLENGYTPVPASGDSGDNDLYTKTDNDKTIIIDLENNQQYTANIDLGETVDDLADLSMQRMDLANQLNGAIMDVTSAYAGDSQRLMEITDGYANKITYREALLEACDQDIQRMKAENVPAETIDHYQAKRDQLNQINENYKKNNAKYNKITDHIRKCDTYYKTTEKVVDEFGKAFGILGVAFSGYSLYNSISEFKELADQYNSMSGTCAGNAEYQGAKAEITELGNQMIATSALFLGIDAVSAVAAVASSTVTFGVGAAVTMGLKQAALIALQMWVENTLEEKYKVLDNKLKLMDCDGDGHPDLERNTQSAASAGLPARVVIDPSGYVYEAVPSNRLEGVKATIYYADSELDDFGVPTGETTEVLWDAENYDQVNPLYTDPTGSYRWDVPFGQWLVTYSKEGYYDTDSRNDPAADQEGYLPVPPPQVEVNTAMVSKAAPVVESVNVYNDEVRIIFSQYMDLTTVNSQNITVQCKGLAVEGKVEPVNAEYNYEGTVQYASVFRFLPTTELVDQAEVSVQNTRNYAGTVQSTAYTRNLPVVVKPTDISVNDVVIGYNDSRSLDIQILPAAAGANKTLTLELTAPDVVSASALTVTADSNGKASITLSGLLPGYSDISISLDGTDLQKTVLARVDMNYVPQATCAKVTASVPSGSYVTYGTEVTLSTDTAGASIYYTLDGTCPCEVGSNSRILYTKPIVIQEDTFLIAYAVKEGMRDSATAGFTYTLCKHSYSNWTVIKEASCKATGTKQRTCTLCGNVETETISTTGHQEMTLAAKAATCTATGLTEGKKCSVCGTITVAQETIPAKGHTEVKFSGKAATCTATGLTEGKKCSVCGTITVAQKTIPAKAHTYDNNVDGTCNVCSVNRETVEIRQVTHMFRMYNPNTGEHFYTGSEEEKGNLVAVGWQYEGVGFTFPANTGAPVHRLFEPATGEHLYTMDEAEKAKLMANGWNYEGIAFNSAYDTEAVQHRLHNPNATVGAYHFTFSEEERQNLINVGWEYQGIGWYSCWK